jgi:hypothetical protein
MSPAVDGARTAVTVTRGAIRVRLVRSADGREIIIDLWEDEARVTCGSTRRDFALDGGRSPPSWIPTAVDFVLGLLV